MSRPVIVDGQVPKLLVTIHRDEPADDATAYVNESTCLDECAKLLRVLAPGTTVYLNGDTHTERFRGRVEKPARRRYVAADQRATK